MSIYTWRIQSTGKRKGKISKAIFLIVGSINVGIMIVKATVDIDILWGKLFFAGFMLFFALSLFIPLIRYLKKKYDVNIPVGLKIDTNTSHIYFTFQYSGKYRQVRKSLNSMGYKLDGDPDNNQLILSFYDIGYGTRGQMLFFLFCKIIPDSSKKTWDKHHLFEITDVLQRVGVVENYY